MSSATPENSAEIVVTSTPDEVVSFPLTFNFVILSKLGFQGIPRSPLS